MLGEITWPKSKAMSCAGNHDNTPGQVRVQSLAIHTTKSRAEVVAETVAEAGAEEGLEVKLGQNYSTLDSKPNKRLT